MSALGITRQDVVAKAASALGFWVNPDGDVFSVAEDGKFSKTLQIPTGVHLRRAQSYIVWLLEQIGGSVNG